MKGMLKIFGCCFLLSSSFSSVFGCILFHITAFVAKPSTLTQQGIKNDITPLEPIALPWQTPDPNLVRNTKPSATAILLKSKIYAASQSYAQNHSFYSALTYSDLARVTFRPQTLIREPGLQVVTAVVTSSLSVFQTRVEPPLFFKIKVRLPRLTAKEVAEHIMNTAVFTKSTSIFNKKLFLNHLFALNRQLFFPEPNTYYQKWITIPDFNPDALGPGQTTKETLKIKNPSVPSDHDTKEASWTILSSVFAIKNKIHNLQFRVNPQAVLQQTTKEKQKRNQDILTTLQHFNPTLTQADLTYLSFPIAFTLQVNQAVPVKLLIKNSQTGFSTELTLQVTLDGSTSQDIINNITSLNLDVYANVPSTQDPVTISRIRQDLILTSPKVIFAQAQACTFSSAELVFDQSVSVTLTATTYHKNQPVTATKELIITRILSPAAALAAKVVNSHLVLPFGLPPTTTSSVTQAGLKLLLVDQNPLLTQHEVQQDVILSSNVSLPFAPQSGNTVPITFSVKGRPGYPASTAQKNLTVRIADGNGMTIANAFKNRTIKITAKPGSSTSSSQIKAMIVTSLQHANLQTATDWDAQQLHVPDGVLLQQGETTVVIKAVFADYEAPFPVKIDLASMLTLDSF